MGTIRLIILALISLVVSCGGSSFKGSGAVKKKDPVRTEVNANPTSLPGTAIPPGFSDGGRAALANRFNDFLFAGNGPGSCGLPVANNPCRAGGTTGLSCPANYATIGAVGDCYQLSAAEKAKYGIPMQCNGNRPLCQKSGKDDPNVVIDIRMIDGSACPAGFSGDSAGSNILGVVSSPAACNNYSTSSFCKKTVPLSGLTAGASIVSAMAIMGSDSHLDQPPACPASFEDVGTAPDCSNHKGDTNIQCCKGRIRFCQKKEIIK